MRQITAAALVLATTTLAPLTSPIPAEARLPASVVAFYERNNASGDIVCAISARPGQGKVAVVLTRNNRYGCDNDEARSMRLVNRTFDSPLVTVFDDSSCIGPPRDDSATMWALSDHAPHSVVFATFQQELAPRTAPAYPAPAQVYDRHNGSLDGKVSCITIEM